ncbi:hypothetical protein [Kitasatospora sp. NPDC001175]|uniref:hypothetical protein n=1 Tax=Kitasatospora sp. NPDC001175 TaxID=3157103 RepID=UPI003D009754
MTYNLLLTGELERDQIVAALAEQFVVPASEVDVVDADDLNSRNWDAIVSCTYEQVNGDVTWSLDIYATEDHPIHPDERQLAAGLADQLGQPVLFPGEERLPSSYWLAAPNGMLTRARLYESDQGGHAYTIDAVGQHIPELPDLPVARLPEVIREHRVDTPVADAFTAWLAEQRLEPDRPGDGSEERAEWHACTRLGAWEAFVVRLSSGWPPDGWYPASYYAEDLEIRDKLNIAEGLTSKTSKCLIRALADIDRNYRQNTIDDGGRELSEALATSHIELSQRNWWWQRRPEELPWSG